MVENEKIKLIKSLKILKIITDFLKVNHERSNNYKII